MRFIEFEAPDGDRVYLHQMAIHGYRQARDDDDRLIEGATALLTSHGEYLCIVKGTPTEIGVRLRAIPDYDEDQADALNALADLVSTDADTGVATLTVTVEGS